MRALAAAQLDAARGSGPLRRAPRLRVAGVGRGRRAPDRRAPERRCRRSSTLVNRYVQREPGEAGISAAGMAARREIDDYLRRLRRRAPTAPSRTADAATIRPTSSTACSTFDGGDGPLDDAEVIDQLVTLFIGGTETLPKVVAGGAYQLWRHPEQRAAVVADPGLAVPAFEEMLRYELPLQFVGRTLLVDAEIAGESMRAGQRVVLVLISANRDEREFADPERFDVDRRMERHLGLGHGVARLHRRARRPPRGRGDAAGAPGPPPATTRSTTPVLEREASEFQVGWATMPITSRGAGELGRSGSDDDGRSTSRATAPASSAPGRRRRDGGRRTCPRRSRRCGGDPG